MASIEERDAALELSSALKALDAAQGEIDGTDWWDGPPFHLEQDRDRATDRVVAAVRSLTLRAQVSAACRRAGDAEVTE